MCVAIHKPAGINLAQSIYQNCFESNSHGAGFAVISKGTLHVEKGFFSFDEFYKAYAPYEYLEAAIHFRIATSGLRDKNNCHPWVIPPGPTGHSFAVIHNGILPGKSSAKKSDTGHFVDDLLTPMLHQHPDIITESYFRDLLEEYIGFGNKIVILRNDGKRVILNEHQGQQAYGCWFSNGSYRDRVWPTYQKWWNGDDDVPSRLSRGGSPDPYPRSTSTNATALLPAVQESLSAATSAGSHATLRHLGYKQRKRLRRQARLHLSAREGVTDLTQVSEDALLKIIRQDYIENFPHAASLPVPELDEEIVKTNYY